jgi:tetratricopeptide (TPR) repeat protein
MKEILGHRTPHFLVGLRSYSRNCGLIVLQALKDFGKLPEAEAAYRQALDIQAKLAAAFPTVAQYREYMAFSYGNLGRLLSRLGKPAEAEAALREGLAITEKLAAELPAVPANRSVQASIHHDLGGVLHHLGRGAEAEAAWRQALDIQAKLVADFPGVPLYRYSLAKTQHDLGFHFASQGNRAEAEAAYRQALAILEKLAAELPAVQVYRDVLAGGQVDLGVLFASQGKRAEAETAYRKALAIREKLATDFPAVPEYRVHLGGIYVNLGNVHRTDHHPEQALQWYAKGIEVLGGVLAQVKVDLTARQFLRNAHWGRAQSLNELKRHADAAVDWDKTMELSADVERPRFRMNSALSRVRAGQVDPALKEAEQLAKIGHRFVLYDAACVFALAANCRQEPGRVLSDEDCARRAMALLQQAVAKGYRDVEHMKKDEDLEALRKREDFKKLLADLEKKAP